MTRIEWDDPTKRSFEAGVDRGVFYPQNAPGVPWRGLVSIQEDPSAATIEPLYFDGAKYRNFAKTEEYSAVLTALAYPPEFLPYDGMLSLAPGLFATRQPRKKRFGMAYRTGVFGGMDGLEEAYKIHLVYNATASPNLRTNQTLAGQRVPNTFQWTINTAGAAVPGFQSNPQHLVLDSREVPSRALVYIEQMLYGTDVSEPYLPSWTELEESFESSGGITEPLTQYF